MKLHLENFTFAELFTAGGLSRLDQQFLATVLENSPELHQQLINYRVETNTLTPTEISACLLDTSVILEQFLASFFHIEEDLAISQLRTTEHNPISVFKKYFILRRAKKELSKADQFPEFNDLHIWLNSALTQTALRTDDLELAIALLAAEYLAEPLTFAKEIEQLVAWCVKAMTTSQGLDLIRNWSSFHLPERLDFTRLVNTTTLEHDTYHRIAAPASSLRLRDGFNLTDPRMDARHIQNEVNYCIYCHDNEGDFCSKGFPVKKGDISQGFKKNLLDVTLTGCPLEEKISEMHYLKKNGHTLASLAMVMVDNPMCPATGHRICNDCMKACIYQKQEPVNTPQVETRVLTDVLELPWGVEIYDLLTRWNPLRNKQWTMQPYNGLKVMIAGMGPAGFTLAHHLLLEGFAVVGFDGLKIEPLANSLIQQPIYRFSDLKENLSERIMAGFGGVAEYGITVRWDKNFLKLIYLSLMRRPHFQVFGGIRFGGTITVEDAWKLGFDHFVIAVGAGLPKALAIPNSLAPNMRQANDFLMALQLGNAAKSSSLTSLQVHLPAVVIGGGLTGVDTATEVQAYYITLVEKIVERHRILIGEYGEEEILSQLDIASHEILAEYLLHGAAILKERQRAAANEEPPNFIKLIHEWGGVTIAYRRSMIESPAYINNHEELQKALEEGVFYLEGLEPCSVDLDQYGFAETLQCNKRVKDQNDIWITSAESIRLPARSIFVATGTQPNTAYEFEHRGTFNRLKVQYQHYEEKENNLTAAHGVSDCKDPEFGPFTSYDKNDHRVSLIGDTHPVFHGSVVKAITSGMRTYPKIVDILKRKIHESATQESYAQFAKQMEHEFSSKIVAMTRKRKNVIELSIKAPIAARHFSPGQFYRLQNFETLAPRIDHTLFQMEPLALVASGCDRKSGILHFIVSEESASSKLCATLKLEEPVSLMGPTGVRAKIPSKHETILIIGNASSFALLQSYGKILQELGNRVLYLGYFKSQEEVFCQAQLEKSATAIIWLVQEGNCITPKRPEDYSVIGSNVIETLIEYHQTKKGIALTDIDRVFLMGGTDLLRSFQAARNTSLKNYLIKDPKVIGSVYGNMQCMLKGVCAQCLQWQIDPETGKRSKAVFACSWQDQPLEIIDIDHMDARKMQNYLLDQLTNLWVDHLFKQYHIDRI